MNDTAWHNITIEINGYTAKQTRSIIDATGDADDVILNVVQMVRHLREKAMTYGLYDARQSLVMSKEVLSALRITGGEKFTDSIAINGEVVKIIIDPNVKNDIYILSE